MEDETRQASPRPPRYWPRWPWALLALLLFLAFLNHRYQWYPWPWLEQQEPAAKIADTTKPPPPPPPPPEPRVIDFGKIQHKADPVLEELIETRKREYGLERSVDMVVAPQEAIRVGEETVTVQDILAEIEQEAVREQPGEELTAKLPVLQTGRPAEGPEEEDLEAPHPPEEVKPPPPPKPADIPKATDYYGVYVVRKGDNLWDIHFSILREYLKNRGVEISPHADERKLANGSSPGVSRILKWAEGMVHIFNVKTKHLDRNLNMLEPEQKVVIFNLTQLHRILGRIQPGQIDRILFDGQELYFPEDRPADLKKEE